MEFLWIEQLLLFPLRITQERETFDHIRKDLGYKVGIWDTREVVGFPYLDIFNKILDGSLSGTVCVPTCLEARSELDQRVLSCVWWHPIKQVSCAAPGTSPSVWGSPAARELSSGRLPGASEENASRQSFTCCWGKSWNTAPQPPGARLGWEQPTPSLAPFPRRHLQVKAAAADGASTYFSAHLQYFLI